MHSQARRAKGRIGLVGALLLLAGCVPQRGVDFGHWAATAERISLIRVLALNEQNLPTRDDLLLVLPPINHMPEPSKHQFQTILADALRVYCPVRILEVDVKGPLAEYVTEANLAPTVGIFDFQEAARIGRLLGATQVLCTRVDSYRLHPPQKLSIYFGIIQANSGAVVAELEGSFDAKEQQVVMAIGDYLQSRRSKEYDRTSLDSLLRSPTEFATFACNLCSREMAGLLWPPEQIKK